MRSARSPRKTRNEASRYARGVPLLDLLDFAKKDLVVRYRASAEPQTLTIEAETASPTPVAYAAIIMNIVGEGVRWGGAGGAMLAPELGRFAIQKAPVGSKTRQARKLVWTVEVAGIAPAYLRVMVERLRTAGYSQPLKSLRIVGSLPPDRTALSAREADVRKWLDDAKAYPDAWPEPGFPLTLARAKGSAVSIQLAVARPIHAKRADLLKQLVIVWKNVVSSYVDDEGSPAPLHAEWFPKFEITRTDFRAEFTRFDHARIASRNVLIGLLRRFHLEQAPIVATIRM